MHSKSVSSSLLGSLRDLFEGVKEYATNVVDFVVSGVQATVNWVIDSVSYVANFIINTFEDVLTIIGGMWARFGAAIGEWLDYLSELFGWGDIWNSKVAIEGIISNGLAQTHTLITGVASKANGLFASVESDVENFFDNLTSMIPGAASMGTASGYGTTTVPNSPSVDLSSLFANSPIQLLDEQATRVVVWG